MAWYNFQAILSSPRAVRSDPEWLGYWNWKCWLTGNKGLYHSSKDFLVLAGAAHCRDDPDARICSATAGLCESPTGLLWVCWCWIEGVIILKYQESAALCPSLSFDNQHIFPLLPYTPVYWMHRSQSFPSSSSPPPELIIISSSSAKSNVSEKLSILPLVWAMGLCRSVQLVIMDTTACNTDDVRHFVQALMYLCCPILFLRHLPTLVFQVKNDLKKTP